MASDEIELDFIGSGAVINVGSRVAVRDALLWGLDPENTQRIAGRQVQIFCNDPAVAAALAWALKALLPLGQWAVNGRAVTLTPSLKERKGA
ncbi:MAG: hypothetical protein QW260_08415 [Thermoproteota archaeon]